MPSGDDSFGGLLQGVVTEVNSCVRYQLSGEIDASNADQLRRRLTTLCEERGPRVELDMADVAFIDSAGVRALVLAQQQADSQGGGLVVLRPSPPVVRLIRLVGFDDLLPIGGGVSWEDLELGWGSTPPHR